MSFYLVEKVPEPQYSGRYDYGHRWSLPGVHCPACNDTWATIGVAYPSVDLSHLSDEEQKKYLPRLEKNYEEFERLREQVRPLVSAGVRLWPGTMFGPVNGRAWGEFGPLALVYTWQLLMRREPLERLQAEGLRGLKGCRTALRFRKKNPPELLEMDLVLQGKLHPDCLPEFPPPCPKCEGQTGKWPEKLLLDAATLPQDLDLFRLADFMGIIVTERFVEAVRRLGYEQDIVFQELPVRGG